MLGDDLAHAQADPIPAGEAALGVPGGGEDRVEVALGGLQESFALARPFRGEQRVAAGEQVLAGAVCRYDDGVQRAMDEAAGCFGGIDVLCNNAGIKRYRRADEYTLEEFRAILDTNLAGTFLCTRHVYPRLQERTGAVVNVWSVPAFTSEARISAYAASKAALLALIRGMAIDLAGDGVRVNAVREGATLPRCSLPVCSRPGRRKPETA